MDKTMVIIPSIGRPELAEAITTVLEQDTPDVDVLVVVDGPQYRDAVDRIVDNVVDPDARVRVAMMPMNTGANGWYGVNVMMSATYMVTEDYEYVMFLDEDNALDSDHVSSCVAAMEKEFYDWVYSLRKIYTVEGEYLFDDNCESLGDWEVFDGTDSHLIDTSCYFFTRDFIRATAALWNDKWGADRTYYNKVVQEMGHENYTCTGKYSVRYRLGGNATSVNKEFFEEGNKIMENKYKDVLFPWAIIE